VETKGLLKEGEKINLKKNDAIEKAKTMVLGV